jgi:outer membrane protein TolC
MSVATKLTSAVTRLTLALALAFSHAAHADYLPDPGAAQAALRAAPAVAQARGELAAQTLRSQGLAHGRDEWTVGADAGQRRIDSAARDQAEWGLALSRPVRLPGRAEADRALGGALTAHAEANLGEALHESGLQLLGQWFDWLTEAGQVQLWRAQTELAEEQLATVDARIRLGEAPRSERVNADAALAQVRLQQQQAATREQQARSRLQGQFPGVPLTADGTPPRPILPAGTADDYASAVLAHSHELARAQRQAEALQAEARQFASRRGVDPSVGVFYKNEMGGDEHVLGVSVALTLPGAARRTDQAAVETLAATAQDAVARLEQRLRADARAEFDTAAAQVANWEQADRAAQALAEAARLAARAYSLGEGSLDQVLLSRRLALEGQVTAQRTQVDALLAQARLKLNAHELWALDAELDNPHHDSHP